MSTGYGRNVRWKAPDCARKEYHPVRYQQSKNVDMCDRSCYGIQTNLMATLNGYPSSRIKDVLLVKQIYTFL